MMWTCNTCGHRFTPPEWLRRKSEHTCLPCRREGHRRYRAKRKAEGNPVPSGPMMSREWHRDYDRAYQQRPGVKEKRAAHARNSYRDPEQRPKIRARVTARHAIRSGALVRKPCEVCGASKTDAHHDDYGKPLDVRWLCRQHHVAHHRKVRRGA